VGADGSRSLVRQKLMPDVTPCYTGYVAWRGVVPESSASELLIKTFVDHFTFQQMDGSHILCYLIPGAEGETGPGKRRINWVWYWNVPEAELPKLMTGVDGRERDFSIPPSQVRARNGLRSRTLSRGEFSVRSFWDCGVRPRPHFYSLFSTWRCRAWCRAGYIW
jgi:2-polyprenyl-6-methoxyphenol hydroxylase-like FAD-dependent oxidoreductase